MCMTSALEYILGGVRDIADIVGGVSEGGSIGGGGGGVDGTIGWCRGHPDVNGAIGRGDEGVGVSIDGLDIGGGGVDRESYKYYLYVNLYVEFVH